MKGNLKFLVRFCRIGFYCIYLKSVSSFFHSFICCLYSRGHEHLCIVNLVHDTIYSILKFLQLRVALVALHDT